MRIGFASTVLGVLMAALCAGADLKAGAGCQGGRVVITNNDSFDWLEPKIEVNGVFVYVGDVIPKGTTLRFFPGIFTKSDGTRLNFSTVACKTIDIHATIDGKRQHWNGGYR